MDEEVIIISKQKKEFLDKVLQQRLKDLKSYRLIGYKIYNDAIETLEEMVSGNFK